MRSMSFFDKLRQQKLLSFTLLLFTLSVGIVIGTLLTTGVKAARGQAAAPDATPLVIPPAEQLPSEFTTLAKQVEPSVVNITTDYTPKPESGARRRSQPPSQEDEDEPGVECQADEHLLV